MVYGYFGGVQANLLALKNKLLTLRLNPDEQGVVEGECKRASKSAKKLWERETGVMSPGRADAP